MRLRCNVALSLNDGGSGGGGERETIRTREAAGDALGAKESEARVDVGHGP